MRIPRHELLVNPLRRADHRNRICPASRVRPGCPVRRREARLPQLDNWAGVFASAVRKLVVAQSAGLDFNLLKIHSERFHVFGQDCFREFAPPAQKKRAKIFVLVAVRGRRAGLDPILQAAKIR